MSKVLRRFRSLPIRSRLALLVAAAVAFAVAAVSVTCWFIVQGRLYDQVDDDLQQARMKPGQDIEMSSALSDCTQTPQDTQPFRNLYSQVVKPDGTPCVTDSSVGAIKVTQADKDVIKEGSSGDGIVRDGTAEDGTPLRVTSRVARSMRRSAKVSASSSSTVPAPAAAAYELRRSSARTRANSSSSSNGLTR